MEKLTTTIMGLEMKSPIIIGASNLSFNIDKLKELEEAGAGAIVFKTLFEEQIQLEALELDEQLAEYNERNAEMVSIFPNIHHGGPQEHLHNVKKAVETLSIPIIGSINCVYDVTWKEYAKELEKCGVAALELNFYDTPKRFTRTAQEIESYQNMIIEQVRSVVDIPVGVKLSRYYSNPLNVIRKMDAAGSKSFTLFNRLFLPHINTEKEEFELIWDYTTRDENIYAQRFIGLLYGHTESDLVGNCGIYETEDVLSMILVGAKGVQMVSAIYKFGPNHIRNILNEMGTWMDEKGYKSIEDFRGKLAAINQKDKRHYTRAQYVDILLKQQPIYKEYLQP